MDEEAIGLMGVLLILTALVLTQPLPVPRIAAPQFHWSDVAAAIACNAPTESDCDSSVR